MKIKEKIQEAQKYFKKGTKFISFNYPEWGKSNEQIDDVIAFKEYQPNFLWVKAKAPFGEIMWMPIYDSNKDQWASTENKTKK
jgi:hypothetical protein